LKEPVTITAGLDYSIGISTGEYASIEGDWTAGGRWHCWDGQAFDPSGPPAHVDCDGSDNGGYWHNYARTRSGTGLGTRATGNTAFAAGKDALASADVSIAMGYEDEATAANAIAMEYKAKACGVGSIVIGGESNHVSGERSFALGGGAGEGSNPLDTPVIVG